MKLQGTKLLRFRWFLLLATIFVIAGSATQAQVSASATADPLLGKWKLNNEKSANPPASEVITITSQGNGFVLNFDVKNDNGYSQRYSIATDMKGATTVKPTYADGSASENSWRVTRQGLNKFEMELTTPTGGWKDEYQVSDDGAKMIMHRYPSPSGVIGGKMDSNGAFHRAEHNFMFDKVK